MDLRQSVAPPWQRGSGRHQLLAAVALAATLLGGSPLALAVAPFGSPGWFAVRSLVLGLGVAAVLHAHPAGIRVRVFGRRLGYGLTALVAGFVGSALLLAGIQLLIRLVP
jgi:hypothetical protein